MEGVNVKRKQKGEVATAMVVFIIVGLFAVLASNGGQNIKKSEVENTTVAEAK